MTITQISLLFNNESGILFADTICMKKPFLFLMITTWILVSGVGATHKIYLIHGFAGLGVEMLKVERALLKEGFDTEIYTYPSLSEDIDTVSQHLYLHILKENPDTISFVTHSMGALVARSVYRWIDTTRHFPYIHRMVMIAPPNKGTPVADFFVESRIARFLGGPNVENLTTDPVFGASRYPIPDCEVGILLGVGGNRRGYNLFLEENNDGLILPEDAKLGNEEDLAFVKASHLQILFKRRAISLVNSFLRKGRFTD